MSTSATERTVGFFDLAEKSAPTEGDVTGRQHMQRRLDLIAEAVGAAGGQVIKQIGDELMCAFEAPGAAVDLAVDLAVKVDAFDHDGAAVALRVGLHHGPVLEEAGDLFGDTVNVAARMTSIASPGQIITTEEIVAALPEEQRASVKLFDEVRVKGSSRTRPIYRVLWSPRSETLGHTHMPALRARTTNGTLTLHHADVELGIGHGDEEIRLGRDARCELVVPSRMASRFHAVVEARSGKFLLRDQSTNGTWVRMQGSPVVTLQREELPLFGEGIISLGEAVGGNAEHLIRFTCF
jgi:class 3 adenylate cyclase